MSDFEDKLNKILSSPEDMQKIMGMARSLSGSLGTSSAGDEPDASAAGADLSSVASAIGSMDPKILRLVMRAFGEYSSEGGGKSELLHAIKPYIKEDKRHRMDRAAEIVKIAGIARAAFSEFSGGDDGV